MARGKSKPYSNLNLTSIGLTNPNAYCADFVRKHDYESFLLAPFYPKSLQGAYFAIKAFSVELAMVQDNVSNVALGKMRMQFWREALKDCAEVCITHKRSKSIGLNVTEQGKPPRHPIALALHEAMQRVHLPLYHFKRLIDARVCLFHALDTELHTPTHLTIDSLTSHAESTSSTVLYLLLSLLSISSSTMSHAASHLGCAQTISTLIRALPFHAKHGRMVIPAEVTGKHGVRQEEVFRYGPQTQGIEDAVFEFATVANDHLMTAREMFKKEGMGGKVPQEARGVFLAGVPIANMLGELEKANFNAFDGRVQGRGWKLPLLVWAGYYKGMF
ncbi:hypothetical protein AMATHDRAFT_73085 [Amanita thiersii Skay4041]|uniref:Squalene/phytoene synthase n=1 Tax=Amanita thiersii Skay4041 TaxID=703135 RepID=A0A2A9NZJ3_9AGAR|nr:hypothetical protein AMATHDRAFT_73085 [Amanita thiersii Skay4041]